MIINIYNLGFPLIHLFYAMVGQILMTFFKSNLELFLHRLVEPYQRL